MAGEHYLDELRQIAEANGGKLLSTEWMGSKAKYRFAFADGRELETTAASIKQGWPNDPDRYFCRSRYSKDRGAIHLEEMRRIAEANGGKLLSTEFHGVNVKYQFAFADGREFKMTIGSLREYGWPKNADRYFRKYDKNRGNLHLTELRNIAATNGGKLLSTEWKGDNAKYKFAFGDGREFEVRATNIRRDGWPKDPDFYFRKSVNSSDRNLLMLDEMRRIAESRGGQLLSAEWRGAHEKYDFIDQAGIPFKMTQNSIKQGCWSASGGLISEEICRQTMKHLFGAEFHKTRAIIKRDVGLPLELDGYAETIRLGNLFYRIAFEYQGHSSHRDDFATINRDLEKKRFCEDNGILLVVIEPFRTSNSWESNYVVKHIREAVANAFRAVGIDLPPLNPAPFRTNMEAIHKAVVGIVELEELAEANGGKLLSTEWGGVDAKYSFAFADGREFEMRAASIKKGWPKDSDTYFRSGCNPNRGDIHLEELRLIAKANGGELLSTEWQNYNAKYRFAFADGREFETFPGTLKQQGWPKDPDLYFKLSAKNPDREVLHLEGMRRIAEAAGGRLLSAEWKGNTAKYRFSFADGREFEMRADKIKGRGWPKNPDQYFKHIETLTKKQSPEARP